MASPMKYFLRGTVAAVLALACAAPADAAEVSVRVEGSSATLVPPTAVTTTAGTFTKSPGAPACQRDSAGGALETATGGNWGGAFDGFGQRVETILGESHVFFSGAYWSIYVNDTAATSGACDQAVQNGDAVTFYPQCEGAPLPSCFDGLLLLASAPATVAPGASAAVAVDQVTTVYAPPTWDPVKEKSAAAGATVTIGGASATVGADGRANVPVGTQTGVRDILVTLPGRVRASGALCVTNGADGACGTTRPGQVLGAGTQAQATPAAGAPTACATSGSDGRCGTRDRQAPSSTIEGVDDRETYARGKGPRRLGGTIGVPLQGRAASLQPDPSGVLMVKLRISRRVGDKCWYFSGSKERFRGTRCGVKHAKWFKIGDDADWSYLLPSRLPRGRYVIDVNAVDKAYNRDDRRQRGRNRVIIRVR